MFADNVKMEKIEELLINVAGKGVFSHKDLFVSCSKAGLVVSRSTLDRRLRTAIKVGFGCHEYSLRFCREWHG